MTITVKELRDHCKKMIHDNNKESKLYAEHKLILSIIEENERLKRWSESPDAIPINRGGYL